MASALTRHVRALFAVDLRSLALWRIALGLTIVLDVADRLHDLHAHYTDLGVLPRTTVLSKLTWEGAVSIHMASGNWGFMLCLFLLQAVWALGLIVGYRSQLMALLSWYWQISLQIRQPLVLHNGDVYVRMILLFACFCPIGARFSIDSMLRTPLRERVQRRQREASGAKAVTWVGGGGVAVIMQLFCVYVVSVIHKYQLAYKPWFVDGSSTWNALQMDFYRRWPGDLLLATAPMWMLELMTKMVLHFEWLGWVLLMFPIGNHVTRTIGTLGYVVMHQGFGAAMRLEQFVWIGSSAPLLLLPPWVWDTVLPAMLRKLWSQRERRIDVIYSPRLSLLADVIETFFALPNATFTASSTEAESSATWLAIGSSADRLPLQNSAALQHIVAASPFFWPFALFLRSAFVRNVVDAAFEVLSQDLLLLLSGAVREYYPPKSDSDPALGSAPPMTTPLGFPSSTMQHRSGGGGGGGGSSSSSPADFGAVADPLGGESLLPVSRKSQSSHRAGSGASLSLWRAAPSWHTLKWAVLNVVALALGYFVLAWCMSNVGFPPTVPAVMRPLASPMMLFQSWHMFSPPPTSGWYHTIELNLKNGQQGSLLPNRGLFVWEASPLTYAQPDPMYESLHNHRWLKYFENFNWNGAADSVRLDFGRFICREWNGRHRGELQLQNHKEYVHYFSVPYGKATRGPPSKSKQWDHNCF